ncbi:hypothetical protein GCM10007924_31140 [Sneathiella chinensis]|uniref:histidine kinase n=1 Tax=Sneathiella chinensis TaxID=349750 RepID=A0ABQ5U6V7_9PROT|nr:hypothetical protein GCM10007924_31140 [Sneathiella chinensis]
MTSSVLLGLLAGALLILEQYLERKELESERRIFKEDVLLEARDFRNGLASHISESFFLLFGMQAYINANPDLSQEEFEKLAASVQNTKPIIRNIAAAPNLVVRYMYPLKGNEAALGLDYRTAPLAQREAAFRTIKEGKVVLAGPVELVQGGQAFVTRIPVTLNSPTGGTESWGFIAAPIDVNALFREVGLADFTRKYKLAIRGVDGLGAKGAVFYGEPALFDDTDNSLFLDVGLINGSWQMAVIPQAGWPVKSEQYLTYRWLTFAAFVFCLIIWFFAILYVREQMLARQRKAAAFREKSEFLEMLTHEIRSPLQGVLGAQKYLLDQGIEEPMRSVVGTAHQSGEYIISLINDYLDLQRAESKTIAIYKAPVDVREMLANVRSVAETGRKNNPVTLQVNVANPVPRFVLLDRKKTEQILVNLVGNGLKFTQEGFVSVIVNWDENGENSYLVLTVEDTGVGISSEDIETLYDRFVRTEDAEKRVGSGLGLSITKSLVEAMGGTINVTSQRGSGTAFTVRLPCCRAAEPGPAPEAAPSSDRGLFEVRNRPVTASAGFKSLKVLAADDIVVNRILLNAMLSPLVHSVVLVENGQQVLDALDEGDFDLVIMDVHMPEMNGIEATRLIRQGERYRNIPVLALTGDDTEENDRELIGAGMTAVLKKPINLEAVLQAMRQAVGRQEGAFEQGHPHPPQTGTA